MSGQEVVLGFDGSSSGVSPVEYAAYELVNNWRVRYVTGIHQGQYITEQLDRAYEAGLDILREASR